MNAMRIACRQMLIIGCTVTSTATRLLMVRPLKHAVYIYDVSESDIGMNLNLDTTSFFSLVICPVPDKNGAHFCSAALNAMGSRALDCQKLVETCKYSRNLIH